MAKETKAPANEGAAYRPSEPNRLAVHYKTNVIPQMVKRFNYENINMVPKVEKSSSTPVSATRKTTARASSST